MRTRVLCALLMVILGLVLTGVGLAENLPPGTDIREMRLGEAQSFSDGFTYITIDNIRYGIDVDGRIVFSVPQDIYLQSVPVNGLAYALRNDQTILINSQGEVVIAPEIQGFTAVRAYRLSKTGLYNVPSSFNATKLGGYRQSEIQTKREENPDSVFGVLKAGYVLVYEKTASFAGDSIRLGVLDSAGNWVMPLNDTCGAQDEIAVFLGGYGPKMMDGKIVSWAGKFYALDPIAQSISVVEPSSGWRDAVEDWQFYKQYTLTADRLSYKRADGSDALDLSSLYPTLTRGSDFLDGHASVRFFSGSAYFTGVIDQAGKLMGEPVSSNDGAFGMLSGRMFYASDPQVEKTHVYGLDSQLLFSLDSSSIIYPFSNGLALVENNYGAYHPPYFINEAGDRVIGASVTD